MNYLSFLKWSPKRYLSIITPDVIFDRFSMHIFSTVQKKIEKETVENLFSDKSILQDRIVLMKTFDDFDFNFSSRLFSRSNA